MQSRTLPELLCLSFQDRRPEFVSAPRRAVGVATVCGRVRVGAGAQLCAGSVIRGDGHEVRIGDDFFMGERSTIRVAHEHLPTLIGTGVTLGSRCALRACRIGDRVVLEDEVVVLDGAVVGAGSVLERGCLVPAGADLPAGYLYRGNPAVAVRALEAGELSLLRGRVRNAPSQEPAAGAPPPLGPVWPGFVALTAHVDGQLRIDREASIWFGARVDGGHHGVHLGEGSNLQDNSSAYAMASPLEIGVGVTVGHNVSLQDCRIGDHSLIGPASFVAAGTVVETDVILAPGSVTRPRQVLHSGWMWGGRPARPLEPMDAQGRAVVEKSARVHRDYLHAFRQAIADYSELG